ncbi:MAG: Sec-independent protein translocase protein TatB, partial [Actinomycetota bacterium]
RIGPYITSMFDIGWSELLVIAVVAIVVVGPKDLPRLMRTFGHYAGKLRRAAADFQRQFEEAMRDTEIEEVKKAIESVRDETPSLDLKAPVDKPIMLPKTSTQPASTNWKGIAAEATPTESGVAKPAAKRKRTAKPKAATSEVTATQPAAAKPRRTRKAKAAEPKPPKAEPKP